MKKILIGLVSLVLITGCGKENKKEKVDYSEYDFVGVRWTRTTEHDTEYITFYEEGRFSYYCACGNSVNDSDLCESYTYDDKTKTVKIKCMEKTNETIDTIKIISYDENNITLDIDGEIRQFKRDVE